MRANARRTSVTPRKSVIVATAVIWLVVLAFAQIFVDHYAHSYPYSQSSHQAEFPLPTTYIGLPVLGTGSLTSVPERWQWYAARCVFLLPPLGLLVAAVRRDERLLIALWINTVPLYLVTCALLAVLTVGSLWLPFQMG